MNSASDVLIIGGGAIGLAIAVELRLRGVSVTLLSRDFKQAASHAAAGMLAPRAEHLDGPMLDLCLQSRALYPDWTQKLEDLTGQSTGYWPCGILSLELGIEGSSPRQRAPSALSSFLPLISTLRPSTWLSRGWVTALWGAGGMRKMGRWIIGR
ncbi:FAD-dependent oxidoreductase [Leptolyngbya sp. O-77]|uniref:FAD-dependent oxidoreductase n=1 Tax=Leptolyngbya sp. O-77 TaxID=1080068 RepID=UPI00074D34F4|nr:FAD-dependent oxidoreductase [Leptolyngbya sp. O-77]BAU40211.1 hypothetical protein O77CONTIG1_00008 [Leptolyngbya sp. O-77]